LMRPLQLQAESVAATATTAIKGARGARWNDWERVKAATPSSGAART